MYKSTLVFFLLLVITELFYAQDYKELSVYFDQSEHLLNEPEKEYLEKSIEVFFQDLDILRIEVKGYCSDPGSEEFNNSLSTNRAQGVAELIEKQMPESVAIEYNGFGEVPLNKASTQSLHIQRDENRRVDVLIYYSEPEIPEVPEIVEEEPIEEESIVSETNQVGDKIVLENILFQGGMAVLLPESYETLEKLVETLLNKPGLSIQIQGHIYGGGIVPGYTGDLSEKRAKAIYEYLIEEGIDEDRLSYIGFEDQFPLGKGSKYDRRVEIEIISID